MLGEKAANRKVEIVIGNGREGGTEAGKHVCMHAVPINRNRLCIDRRYGFRSLECISMRETWFLILLRRSVAKPSSHDDPGAEQLNK